MKMAPKEILIEKYGSPIIERLGERNFFIKFLNDRGQLHRLNNLPAYYILYDNNNIQYVDEVGFYKNGKFFKGCPEENLFEDFIQDDYEYDGITFDDYPDDLPY